MQADHWEARVDRHIRLRWVGVALFAAAVVVSVGGVAALFTGHAGLRIVPWCLLALGLSLSSFGTNDNTALHALVELSRQGRIPARHKAEWDKERGVRGQRLLTLHTHPRASLILPFVSGAVILLAAWRVGAAWRLLT